jgi:hypothetical protein
MNRETYPASLFPLRGDLSAEAGATTVKVIGIQTFPIDAPVNPADDGKVPTFVAADGRIEWRVGGGSTVSVNGVGVSNDYLILADTAIAINYSNDVFLGVRVNGTLVGN